MKTMVGLVRKVHIRCENSRFVYRNYQRQLLAAMLCSFYYSLSYYVYIQATKSLDDIIS